MEKDEKSYFVTMALMNVTVEDAGKYKVTAKNELGETAANISLNFDSEYDGSPDTQTHADRRTYLSHFQKNIPYFFFFSFSVCFCFSVFTL